MVRLLSWTLLLVGSLVLVSIGQVAAAQESQPPPANETEAQRLYREAYEASRQVWDDLHEVDADILDVRWNYQGQPERLPTDVGDAFNAKFQPALNKLREAWEHGDPQFVTDANRADMWQDSSHISYMRSLTMELAHDIDWRVQQGKTEHIAEDMAGILQMGLNVRNEKTVMGSLVDFSINSMVFHKLDETSIAAGALSASDANLLLEQIDKGKSFDEFGMAAAWDEDRKLMADYLFDLADDQAQRDEFLQSKIAAGANVEIIESIGAMSADEMKHAALLYDASQAELVRLMQIEDFSIAKREIDELNEAIANGDYGPLAPMVGSNFNPIELIEMSLELQGGIEAKLRSIANDPDGRAKNMNAAYFYRRAFAQRDLVSNETWKEVETLANVDWKMTPTLPWWQLNRQERLDAMSASQLADTDTEQPLNLDAMIAAVMTELAKAATVEPCEFRDFATRKYRRAIFGDGDFINPMLECATVALASHALAIEQEQTEQAEEAAVVLAAMADHLTQQGDYLSSELARKIIEAAMENNVFADAGNNEVLQSIIARFDADDPFGNQHVMQLAAAAPTQMHTFNSPNGPANSLSWIKRSPRTQPPVSNQMLESMTIEAQAMRIEEFKFSLDELTATLQAHVNNLTMTKNETEIAVIEKQFFKETDEDIDLAKMPAWVRYFAEPIFAAARGYVIGKRVWSEFCQ